MKINVPYEQGFRTYPHDFCGIEAELVIPEIETKWNKHNLFFRSLVIDKQAKQVLSCGWPKFFNYGEKQDCYPDPASFKDWIIQEKIDGSLVICDYVNSQLSFRTRGTTSYRVQENWKDFELLVSSYPLLPVFMKDLGQHLSLLIEITTPNNPIVIMPETIQFTLLGAVNKNNLNLTSFEELKVISNQTKLKLPFVYEFANKLDIHNLVQIVKTWKNKEGIVLSYNNYQNRIKIKSDWYLWLHRIKSQLNSEDNLISLFVDEGLPNYEDFYSLIEKTFDWEIAEQLKGNISKICDASEIVHKIITGMKEFIKVIKPYSSRKEQAQAIMSSYGGESNNRSAMLFTLLDGKELTKEHYTKLLHQILNQ